MTCSRVVNTTFPSATLPSLRMASRMTAKGLLSHFTIRNDVIGIAQVDAFVDVLLWDELFDFEGMLAVNGNGFQLFGIELDILALTHLISLDDFVLRHFIAGFGIDLAILDPVTGLFVELMEADLFAFGGSGE